MSTQTPTAPANAAPPDPQERAATLLARPAGALARSIQPPIDLPMRLGGKYAGKRLKTLSVTSVKSWLTCRETWKRQYILGERFQRSGAMFVGSVIDETFNTLMLEKIAGNDLTLDEVEDLFAKQWATSLEEEDGDLNWSEEGTQDNARAIGEGALRVAYDKLLPRLGVPTAVQREFLLSLGDHLHWRVRGFVDFDTIRQQDVFLSDTGEMLAVRDEGEDEPTVTLPYEDAPEDLRPPLTAGKKGSERTVGIGEARELQAASLAAREQARADGKTRLPAEYKIPDVVVPTRRLAGAVVRREVESVTDLKVKNRAIQRGVADHDLQASTYLLDRHLSGRPALDFTFAQAIKAVPGTRENATTAVVRTTRTQGQLHATLALYAQVAAEIVHFAENVPVEAPWGFAEPGSWKCLPNEQRTAGRFCTNWANCPMGAGL